MPLYRQEQMRKTMGVGLKRGTMAHWVIQMPGLHLRPFWRRIQSELLTQSAIHADAGAQGERQADRLGIAHLGLRIGQTCVHPAALL